MTYHPITFNAPMIRALLERRKSQTRRLVEPQPSKPFDAICEDATGIFTADAATGEQIERLRAKFRTGDRLWVREAWRTNEKWDAFAPRDIPPATPISYEADADECVSRQASGRYRHARFMPRWASRLDLLVTHVHIQRLQEISEIDAMAEGILRGAPLPMLPNSTGYIWHSGVEADLADPFAWTRNPVQAFCNLWQHIHGTWDANPWVFAISFTVEDVAR